MPRMQHRVTLSAADRTTLRTQLNGTTLGPRARKRAQALVLTDRAGPAWPDTRVATAVGLAVRTVCRLRLEWTERGLAAIHPRGTPSGRPKLDDEQTARILALYQAPPPPGQAGWTLRMLASRAVELEIVDSVSYETIRRMFKKSGCNWA